MTSSSDELSELGKAALWYVENGFAVIPLVPREKRPATINGLNDWTDDPDSVRALWGKEPNFNIGIVCGTPSHGLLVFDFDIDEDRDKDGMASLSAWERANAALPPTAIAETGSGGMHYLYRTDRSGVRPSVNHELGVDVRCDGSYIVAPPSIHPNGRIYAWQDDPEETPIATANGTVYDFLEHVQRNGGQDETRKDNGKFKLPERIGKGKRDDTLFRYASHLRAIGRSDEEILSAVAGVNALRCDPPMDSRDIERICASACKYERGGDDRPDVGRPGRAGGGGGEVDTTLFTTPKGRVRPNALGQFIIERNHGRHIDGALAVWTGARWEFGRGAVERLCLKYADEVRAQERNEVYAYMELTAKSVSSENSFDGRHYIQFANCTWDVLGDREVEPTPDMLITSTLPVALDVDAPEGAADEFISSLAAGDAATERVLCEVIGACMCSRRVISQSPMLIGRANGSTASNGKSTYINVLRALLGTDNVSSLDIATLGQKFQAGRIVGKLANLGDDIPDGFLRGDELSLFKKLVTGDQIYTDVKNARGFEFRPSATMVFSMNAMPRLADTTDGVFRRLAFVPFRNHFEPGCEGYDPDMAAKMTTDENLQRLALMGLLALHDLIKRHELTRIPDMEAEVEEVKTNNDVVKRWIVDTMIGAEDLDGRWVKDAYTDFRRWCDEAGEKFGVAQVVFTKRVLALLAPLKTIDTRDRALGKKGRKFVLGAR